MNLAGNSTLSALLLVLVVGSSMTEAFTPTRNSQVISHNAVLHASSPRKTRANPADCHDEKRAITNEESKSRQEFLQAAALSLTTIALPMTQRPSPANAEYGTSSNMELPNYIEFLIEKNTIVDQSKFLYKGTDIQVQISRISDASKRLSEIPSIAREKKWSQVQGILTGPLGTLIQTMNSLCKDTDSSQAKKAAAKVKSDIIVVSQEATRKNEAGVVKACEDAQKDLEAFAKLVF